MNEYEKVEKLREKANVSYEEAKAALEKCNWDLLDAIVLLEREGKINDGAAHHSTRTETAEASEEPDAPNFSVRLSAVWAQVRRWIQICNENRLVIHRNDQQIIAIPLTVLIVLLLFGSFWLLAVLAAGLFFGFRYSIQGEQLGTPQVNDVMDKAANAAENVRETVEDSLRKEK